MLQRLNENKDLIIVAIASFFIGFGAASFFGASSKNSLEPIVLEQQTPLMPLPPVPPIPIIETGNPENPNEPSMIGTDAITVENQRAGTTVIVQRAEFTQPRWIVVREMREGRDMGNILGAGWFRAGIHEHVAIELLRGTTGGEEYYVVVFADEGADKRFDHTVDKPLMNVSGNVVRATFSTVANPGS